MPASLIFEVSIRVAVFRPDNLKLTSMPNLCLLEFKFESSTLQLFFQYFIPGIVSLYEYAYFWRLRILLESVCDVFMKEVSPIVVNYEQLSTS